MAGVFDTLLEQGFTEEDIELLMEAGVLQGEQERILPEQRRLAEEFRSAEMPEGRAYGGVYQSASPWEAVGTGLQRGLGIFQDMKANQRQKEILKQLQQRRSRFLQGMGGGGSGGGIP